jgi:hypothetical protein
MGDAMTMTEHERRQTKSAGSSTGAFLYPLVNVDQAILLTWAASRDVLREVVLR